MKTECIVPEIVLSVTVDVVRNVTSPMMCTSSPVHGSKYVKSEWNVDRVTTAAWPAVAATLASRTAKASAAKNLFMMRLLTSTTLPPSETGPTAG